MRQLPILRLAMLTVLSLSAASLAGCDASSPIAPRRQPGTTPSRSVQGATKQHVELAGGIDQYFAFECLDEPIRFVVEYTWLFDWTNTPSGMSNVRSQFIVDRSVSYVVYHGEIYTPSRGKAGHDDNIHYQYRPDGTYIEHGVEPDFEQSASGDRLRLNFVWHTVIEPDGTVQKATLTGNCLPN